MMGTCLDYGQRAGWQGLYEAASTMHRGKYCQVHTQYTGGVVPGFDHSAEQFVASHKNSGSSYLRVCTSFILSPVPLLLAS